MEYELISIHQRKTKILLQIELRNLIAHKDNIYGAADALLHTCSAGKHSILSSQCSNQAMEKLILTQKFINYTLKLYQVSLLLTPDLKLFWFIIHL